MFQKQTALVERNNMIIVALSCKGFIQVETFVGHFLSNETPKKYIRAYDQLNKFDIYFCSYSVQCFSLWDVYIGISPYRTLAAVWTAKHGGDVTWSCEKIQTLLIFYVICEHTVQWTHFIHWTSAVFFYIALKCTPFTTYDIDRMYFYCK